MIVILLTALLKSDIDRKVKKFIIILSLTGILFFLSASIFAPQITNNVWGKIQLFQNRLDNNYYNTRTENIDSAGVRYYAIIKSLAVFLKNPLFGVGYIGLKNIVKTNITCTFVNWFACYGIIYGSIMTVGIYKFVCLFSDKKIIKIISLIFIFLIIISEDYLNSPFFFILVFYGLSSKGDNLYSDQSNVFI